MSLHLLNIIQSQDEYIRHLENKIVQQVRELEIKPKEIERIVYKTPINKSKIIHNLNK